MKRYLSYLKYVLRHKWFVFVECCKLGMPVAGFLHDLSKFRPSEFIPYARHFYDQKGNKKSVRDKTGYYKPTDTGDVAFDYAWFLHQKRNKHHWQYWTNPEDGGEGVKAIKIPHRYVKEMVCDWKGAGKAQGTPDSKGWYLANKHKLVLHPEARTWVENHFGVMEEVESKLVPSCPAAIAKEIDSEAKVAILQELTRMQANED